MNNREIIEEVESTFDMKNKPDNFFHENVEDPDYHIYKEILQDYGSLELKDIDYEKCSMILCDIEFLSDDQVLYFLPKLVDVIFKEDGMADLLAYRLEGIDLKRLSVKQQQVINNLIESLFEFEKSFDI
jgi:hypothetical protein